MTVTHAALFDTYFNATKAAKEHLEFQGLLEQNGATVYTVKEILLMHAVTKNGEPIEGEALEELKAFARSCVRINTTNDNNTLNQSEIEEQENYLDGVFQKMHPVDLVRTILLQPNLILKKTLTNTFVTADYNANPVMNLYFSRDQLITTAKGVIITNLNSPQREIETKILSICLKKLGITPILDLPKVNTKAFLEGGDFYMLNDTALIGCGMRTNEIGIQQLMESDAIGAQTVAVVKDKYHYQPQMHLDTYFNIIDKDLVAISEDRFNPTSGSKQELLVDLYIRKNRKYSVIKTNISFKNYLLDYLKVTVIILPEEDQKNYGLNFLCIGPRNIIAVDGQSQNYKTQMNIHNVTVQWVNFTNLKQGWGAAHCTTQVINRKK